MFSTKQTPAKQAPAAGKWSTSRILAGALAGGVALGAALLGCGTSTNNDQGASFTATGYFRDGTGCDEGLSGAILPLSQSGSAFGDNAGGGIPLDGQIAVAAINFTNRLTNQFIRLDRIDCDYSVAGSTIQIPSDSFASGAVIEKTPGQNPTTITFSELCQGFEIVSPDIYAFINNNRDSFPELPFRMIATCRGVGVTQSGDTLVTNPLNFFIQYADVSECCTGLEDPGFNGGFQQGPGTGGDLETTTGTRSGGTTGTLSSGANAVSHDDGSAASESQEQDEGDSAEASEGSGASAGTENAF